VTVHRPDSGPASREELPSGREPQGPPASVPDFSDEDGAPVDTKNPWSIGALVLTNLIPLFGVLFWHWSLFSVVFLYWLESAIIGFFNVLKMISIGGLLAIPLCVFFVFHYGIFMLVHLMFIIVLFGGQRIPAFPPSGTIVFDGVTALAFISLFISHGVSYFSNFLGNNEYEYTPLPKQMFSPYKRIVVMHLTIIFGGMMAMAVGVPPAALVVMILLKIGADLFSHLKEHRVSQPAVP